MATRPEDVAALAEAAGVELQPARYAIIAAALDAFAPLLGSIDAVAVGDEPSPEIYDARW